VLPDTSRENRFGLAAEGSAERMPTVHGQGGQQMTTTRARRDAADRTAQGIDRMLRNVETGRFERSLSAL